LIGTFIDELVANYPIDKNSITLIGFSQGAILSYGVALSNPKKIKNVIGLSGYVSEPILKQGFENNDFSTLGIFASHGTVDQVIPIEWARKSDNFLTQTNITHTYKEYPIGHGISPQVFFDFKNWLQAHS
jgi:phospholipase/carboxylesterase